MKRFFSRQKVSVGSGRGEIGLRSITKLERNALPEKTTTAFFLLVGRTRERTFPPRNSSIQRAQWRLKVPRCFHFTLFALLIDFKLFLFSFNDEDREIKNSDIRRPFVSHCWQLFEGRRSCDRSKRWSGDFFLKRNSSGFFHTRQFTFLSLCVGVGSRRAWYWHGEMSEMFSMHVHSKFHRTNDRVAIEADRANLLNPVQGKKKKKREERKKQ